MIETAGGAPTAEQGVTHVLKPEAVDALRRFQDPRLVAGGHLTLISLDALAEAYGNRWSLQAPRVEKFVQRHLTRELKGEAQFLHVSPTDVLIVRPEVDRVAAQVASLRDLRQVLHHFLGRSARALDGVYEVIGVHGDRVEARPVDRASLAALEQAADLERERAEDLARATEAFMASHGRKIRVSCDLQPLLNLHKDAIIGLRLAQRVNSGSDDAPLPSAALAAFAGVDRQRVDWATIIHGLSQLRERSEKAPTLVLSMSYASLSSQRGRSDMVDLLRQARERAAHGVICEVSGVEGAPHAQLQEAIGIIRPMSLFVVGKIDNPAQVVWSHLKGVGLRGLGFDCQPADGRAEFLGWANATIARGRSVAASVLLYGVPSRDLAPSLAEAGATHATLRAD
jgi:hypothetical protein